MKKNLSLGILLSVIFALTANPQTGHVESSGLMKLRQETHPEIFKNEIVAQPGHDLYKNHSGQLEDFGEAPETDFMKKFGGVGKR